MTSQVKKKWLIGIITISIIEIAIGGYGIFLALNIIISFSKIAKDLTPYKADKFTGAIPISIITLLFSSFIIFLGVSLIKRRRISRLIHIILCPLIAAFIVNTLWGLVIQLISYLNISSLLNLSELVIAGVLVVIITIGYFYYFTRAKVKEQFK